jgi:transcriptional regulator with XRE-family HTH domain
VVPRPDAGGETVRDAVGPPDRLVLVAEALDCDYEIIISTMPKSTSPQVARLELGEVNPSMDTLMRIAAQLQIEFTIDVRPAGAPARNVTKRAKTEGLVGTFRTDEAELLVAAR